MSPRVPPAAAPEVRLTAAQARRLALRAQGLGSDRDLSGRSAAARTAAVGDLLVRLGAVQLDTISVLARSHELVAYARLGAVGREAVERAYWDRPARAFEYWSHAACVLPIDSYPLFAFRRREFLARGQRWHQVPTEALQGIRDRLHDEGPLTTGELGGARAGAGWWDWSATKIGIEWLWDIGEVVVTRRTGWRRVYDLAERAVPQELLEQRRDDTECLRELVAAAGRTLGVGTLADLADVHRLKTSQVREVLPASGLVPVRVDGWSGPAWADPEALESADRAVRAPTTLLSPFDSLVWRRERTARIFGIEHRLEAYTPAADRVHGYFAMPVLHRGHVVARVDPGRLPARRGQPAVLVAKRVTFEQPDPHADAVAGVATALHRAAAWVDAGAVQVEHVTPAAAAGRLRAALG